MTVATSPALNSLGLPTLPAATRVVVAMSGGVDSSVVAAMLVRQGYDVIGITLQLYDHGAAVRSKGACCAGQDIHDARRVAESLAIPHYVLDYERRFATEVMDAFADSYLAGETPVPCVACNQSIKFRDLLVTARQLGAHALATGHYIRRTIGASGPELHRAADAERDQSYFLFATTREQLDFLRFPLGDMGKREVRALAAELGLKVAGKSDSQDICFVPTGRYAQVIERLRPDAAEPGAIMHVDGRALGLHKGIINFTIGQRRGIGVPGPEPLYVVRLDAARREVVVGPRECLRAHSIRLRGVNWLGDGEVAGPCASGMAVDVKIRSTQAPRAARLFRRGGAIMVGLDAGEDGVSPGQACVFYRGTRVLGGGWIEATESSIAARTARGGQSNKSLSPAAAVG